MVWLVETGGGPRRTLPGCVHESIWKSLSEFGFQSRLSTWIATIAYRHAINHLRKKKILIEDFAEVEISVEPDNIEEQDIEAYILKLVDVLPSQYKIVLTLYHLEQKNYAEIGEIYRDAGRNGEELFVPARQLLKDKAKKYLRNEEWT